MYSLTFSDVYVNRILYLTFENLDKNIFKADCVSFYVVFHLNCVKDIFSVVKGEKKKIGLRINGFQNRYNKQ